MDLKIISESSFLNSNSQSSFYSFFSASLITIVIGFLAAGRNGLMFDTRSVRGFHRVPFYVSVCFFCCYSIFLSVPQWILNSDSGYCTEHVQFYNETNTFNIKTVCSNTIRTLNALFFVIILIDPFYIFIFFNICDFRSATTLSEGVKVRKKQSINVLVSFILLIAKVSVSVPRFVLILISADVSAIIVSAFNIILLTLNFFIHVRTLMLHYHWLSQYTEMKITDISKNQHHRLVTTDSDDDHDISINSEKNKNYDDDDDSSSSEEDDGINETINTGKTKRPRQSITF